MRAEVQPIVAHAQKLISNDAAYLTSDVAWPTVLAAKPKVSHWLSLVQASGLFWLFSAVASGSNQRQK